MKNSKRTAKILKVRAEKKAEKVKRYKRVSHVSDYARKRDYCRKNAVWGFDVPEPKPWKRAGML